MVHPNDMTSDELRDVVRAMSLAALDLAQHLAFTNDMLREDLREGAYKRAEEMAYQLCNYPYDPPEPLENPNFDVVVFGANGLQHLDIGWSDLADAVTAEPLVTQEGHE